MTVKGGGADAVIPVQAQGNRNVIAAQRIIVFEGDVVRVHERRDGEPGAVGARLRELVIAYLLEHRPGRFLVVRSDEPASLTVSTAAVRKLVGPAARLTVSSSGAECAVELAGAGTWLLEVETPAGEAVTVQGLATRTESAGFEPWNDRGVASLSGSGVWPLRGPEPRKTLDTSAEPIDAELLEELKRLGYAE